MLSQEPRAVGPAFAGRPSSPGRLLIVDRDVVLADSVVAAAREAGFRDVEVIAGPEFVPRYVRLNPQTVILCALDLAVRRDCRLLHEVEREAPDTPVVVIVDGDGEGDLVLEALLAGAQGVVYRDQRVASLARVLEVVRRGDVALPRQLTPRLLERARRQPVPGRVAVRFSERQRAVLDLVQQGMSDKEIAERLLISPITVRSHLKSIFEKIGVCRREDAARWAADYL